jgi:UDP-N-acetylglucosamine 2-epimerase (non-hydrolysing)
MSRRIAVLTGTRAEYGLLYWTMRELQERGADLKLIVTGSHLSAAHGHTVSQIEADGFPISAKVDMHLGKNDHPAELTRAMGRCMQGMADALEKISPEIAVILGDRYEMLAAASACAMLKIPIAHIHGGEVTEGALDESIRHAITKLSYWHFATADAYAKRIVQMGENPAHVFSMGAPGIDNIAKLPLLSRQALEKELAIILTPPLLLLTYHPETLSSTAPEAQLGEVLKALESFPDATLVITGANADSGGQAINHLLQKFADKRPRTLFRASFGSLLYLSAMKHCGVVVGNSSSGMIETPTLGRATVNIGERQKGRLRTPGVIDCACESQAIIAALKKALSSAFQASLTPSSLFGTPGSVGMAIAEKLSTLAIPPSPTKSFFDIGSGKA